MIRERKSTLPLFSGRSFEESPRKRTPCILHQQRTRKWHQRSSPDKAVSVSKTTQGCNKWTQTRTGGGETTTKDRFSDFRVREKKKKEETPQSERGKGPMAGIEKTKPKKRNKGTVFPPGAVRLDGSDCIEMGKSKKRKKTGGD